MLARGLMIGGRADEAVALVRRAAAELPPTAELLLAALEAVELTAPLFGGSEPVAPERFAPHRQLPLPPGPGAKLLAAIAVHEWAYSGGSAAECVPLARAALEGGELMRVGNVVLSSAATLVLVIADADAANDALDALLAHAHSSGWMGITAAVGDFRGYL
jgi:hypothetical protein